MAAYSPVIQTTDCSVQRQVVCRFTAGWLSGNVTCRGCHLQFLTRSTSVLPSVVNRNHRERWTNASTCTILTVRKLLFYQRVSQPVCSCLSSADMNCTSLQHNPSFYSENLMHICRKGSTLKMVNNQKPVGGCRFGHLVS